RVGECVRLARARRGMSRKSLSKASGVSERYLAELERGAGNASLLVLRQIADALSVEAAALVSEAPERPIDLTLTLHQLERLMADGPQAMDDLKAILESRTALYAKANAVVNTGGKSEAQAFAALLAVIPRSGEPAAPA